MRVLMMRALCRGGCCDGSNLPCACGCEQEVVILETEVAKKATQETLTLHSIPAAVSKDLLDAIAPAASEEGSPAAAPAPELAAQH